jgi:hypothetical protein
MHHAIERPSSRADRSEWLSCPSNWIQHVQSLPSEQAPNQSEAQNDVSNKAAISGGYGFGGMLDLHLLDLTTLEWSIVHTTGIIHAEWCLTTVE